MLYILLFFNTDQDVDYKFPGNTVHFKYKTDTDLYELAKCKTYALSIAFSPDGKLFACTAPDRHVRVFHFLTGKKSRVFNESLEVFTSCKFYLDFESSFKVCYRTQRRLLDSFQGKEIKLR